MSKSKLIVSIAGLILLIGIILIVFLYQCLFVPCTNNNQTNYLYIDRDDNIDSLSIKLQDVGKIKRMTGFNLLSKYQNFDEKIHTGRYEIVSGKSILDLYRQLSRGQQSPLKLIVPSTRTIGQLIKTLDKQLMVDSTEISKQLFDKEYYKTLGFDERTLPSFFIPNTYEVYWNISAEKLLKKMQDEKKRFWNDESGMGTVEVILIIVVLIGLVIVFKEQISGIVEDVFRTIRQETIAVTN